MRTNSPMSDPEAFDPVPEKPVAEAPKENEFAMLGKDPKKWPEVVDYLRERQQFYRQYMPDGTALQKLSAEEAGAWWKCAATIIAEFESFIVVVETHKDAIQ